MLPTLIFHFGSSSVARASVAPSRADGEKIGRSVFIEGDTRDITMLRCAIVSQSSDWEDTGH